MKKRIIIATSALLLCPLLVFAQYSPFNLMGRTVIALEAAWAALGGAAVSTEPGVYGLQTRLAEASEGIQAQLEAAYWDDSQVPALAIVPGATAPGLISFATNDLMKIYGFDGAARDEVAHFTVQLSHRYKEGTPIYPHIHWCRTTDPGDTDRTNVVFKLVYSFQSINGGFTSGGTNSITNYVAGTNWNHQISAFTPITNASANISAVLVGSITRVSTDGGDTYDQDAGFLGFDIHHQVNGFGSDEITSKSF